MRRRFRSVLLALAGMLFLQAAIAFAPCELPGRSAATGMAAAMAGMPDCHEADAANLCLAHCASQDESLLKVSLELPQLATPPATPIVVAARIAALRVDKPGLPLSAAGPPARILFRSFLL
jgi:hypothetical protein